MVIVLNSVGNKFRVFSKVRLTSANPLAERVLEPLKTRLSRFSERRWLIFCSPITQRILSTIFDLPHPLGPMIPVTPSSKLTIVLSAKLLNPFISKLFNRTILTILLWTKVTEGGRKLVLALFSSLLIIHYLFTNIRPLLCNRNGVEKIDEFT